MSVACRPPPRDAVRLHRRGDGRGREYPPSDPARPTDPHARGDPRGTAGDPDRDRREPGEGGAAADDPAWTTPFYPAQRRREDTWPPTTPLPSGTAQQAPATVVLPALDHPAPLPRTGDEPLPDLARDAATESEDPTTEVASDADPDLTTDADTDAVAAGWELVRATQDGDAEAFGRLYDRYHDVVFRFVLYRLGDRSLAEDLTQETFVRAYRRITSVSYQGRDIGAWFVTIARNLVLDHVKSSRYRLETAIPEITDVVSDRRSPGPESEVIAGAIHAELLRCVHRLRDDQQECITLRFLQGLSVAETAVIMERNEGAVKALQHRAVRRLAQLMPEGLR